MTGSHEVAENPFVGPCPLATGERLWGRELEVRELEDLLSAFCCARIRDADRVTPV